jgi:hypothetical protein
LFTAESTLYVKFFDLMENNYRSRREKFKAENEEREENTFVLK